MVSSQSNMTNAVVLASPSPPPIRPSVLAAAEEAGVGLGQGDAGGLASSSDSDSHSLSLLLLLLLLLLPTLFSEPSSLLSKPSIASLSSSTSLQRRT